LIDVAGVDESRDADDAIARQMDEQARRTVETADFVLFVTDATDARPPLALPRAADLVVQTKADLTGRATPHAISARTGHRLDELREELDALAFGRSAGSSTLALNARHLAAIADARAALVRARDIAQGAAPELIALELRDALDHVGRVRGQVTPDDVLGRVFATFCIGK
jgi:tRNA modification GTPase